MAIENFTTYEEVDPNSRVEKTSSRVTWTDLLISEDAKVYYNKGVNFFNGDFTHYLTVSMGEVATYDGRCFVWALTNAVDSMYGIRIADGDYLTVYVYQGSTTKQIYLEECNGGYRTTVAWVGMSFDTPYYLKIVRDESVGVHGYGTLYCYIYDDEARTNLVDTLEIALHSSKKDFRYIFALNSYGAGASQKTSGYSENLDLLLGPPTVTTQAVSNIATTTATGNGNITDLGSPNPTAHGVCYNTTGSPTIADDTTDEGATTETGAFTTSITGLSTNTKYYVKAYATNGAGTGYGSEVNFTTLSVPTVTTQAMSSIVTTTATGNGNVTDLGDTDVTQHGHCWNTTGTPTTSDNKTENGDAAATGAFTSSITGLTVATLYYVRAYATNTGGTSYGGQVAFIAGALVPGEGSGIYAVVEERFHYVDAYGVERYIEGTIV